MFKSARVKLTLFYLAVLVAFSLTCTGGFRILFDHEYDRSDSAQRHGVQQLLRGMGGVYEPGGLQPFDNFYSLQRTQATDVHVHLDHDLILINVAALAIGGALSYWFAGRTLKPIEEVHIAQARFASDASHELRTPLTNLRLENEVFLRQHHFSENEARDLINSNLEEVQRLEDLSANLLALTQYGNTPLRTAAFPVRRIVEAATKTKEKVASQRRVVFSTDNVFEAKIVGNRESLEECLSILLDNAIKYGPDNGVVRIAGKIEDGHYLLWVQDEGPGISADDLPHIFDRLYRGDKARNSKVGVYGLGLALAKTIARANDAQLRAENVPGGGACFTLRLPLAR